MRRPSGHIDSDKCYPIEVPRDDPFWGPRGVTCLDFARSIAAPSLKCQLGFRQQMNQITHWLDSSNVYGSNADVAGAVRDRKAGLGLLAVGAHDSYAHGTMPLCGARSKDPTLKLCSGGSVHSIRTFIE